MGQPALSSFGNVRTVAMVGALSLLAPAQDAATKAPATPTGAIGLANRWYTQGGCASRSNATATPALLVRPVFGWQFEGKGKITGEPLVWDDVVVVELHLGGERRQIQVLALGDGTPVASREMLSPEPLAPTLWNREVVVRVGKQLKRFLFGKAGFSEQRASKPGAYGPPLRLGEELYVVVDGGVERWNANDFKSVWRYDDEGDFAGPVSVRGDSVFAMRGLGQGIGINEINGRLGTTRGKLELGLPMVPVGDVHLAVGPATLVVRVGETAGTGNDRGPKRIVVPLPMPTTFETIKLVQMDAAPAIAETFWVGACGVQGKPQLVMFGTKKGDILLANAEAHASLVKAPATVASGMLYLGGVAVDPESRQIRWRLEVPPGARAVVARDTLLFAKDQKLVAYRDAAAVPPVAAAGVAAAIAWDDAAVGHRRELLQALALDALKGLELDFLDAVLARCRLEGVEEKWVTAQANLRKSKARLVPQKDPLRLPALQARLDGLEPAVVERIWIDVQSKAPASAGPARRAALRFVLDAEPGHAGAVAAVRSLLPAGLRSSEPFDAREWLDYVVVTDQVLVEFLATDSKPGTAPTADQLKLLEFRQRWREDLIALQSQRLIVYTPVTAPGSIARCLSLGELVCNGLEAMFADFPVMRQDPRRMRLCLFASEAEYKKHSPGGGHLAWTSGHYSPKDELSRMYVPKDAEAFARVMPVFAHELTHQWLEDRCPALNGTMLSKRTPDQPGHWIVEGFASFVEQFVFDLAQRSQQTDNPCDEHLDVLAHATAAQLLPWKKVLAASHVDFSKIPPVPDEARKVTLGHQLGSYQMLSQRNFFYAQAGALCHWLWHAEAGRHRRALLEFVLAYYSGDASKLDLGKTLGMTPEAIGAAVVAHAKAKQP